MLSFSRVGSSKLPTTPHGQLRFMQQSISSVFHCQRSQKHVLLNSIQHVGHVNAARRATLQSVGKTQRRTMNQNTPWQRQAGRDAREHAARKMIKASRQVVAAIILLNCGLFGWYKYQEMEYRQHHTKAAQRALIFYNQNMVLSGRNVNEGRWYTKITSAFSHGGILHLGFNMLALWSFGPQMAFACGIGKFLTVYLGSAWLSSEAQLYWDKLQPRISGELRQSLGASGAIGGILAATAGGMPHQQIALMVPIPIPIRMGVGILAAGSVAALQNNWLPGIGHAGHLGGMAFGALFWLVTRGRFYRRF